MLTDKEREMLIAILFKSLEESEDEEFIPGEQEPVTDTETNTDALDKRKLLV